MNALVAKEIRLLLPAYGMALVLAAVPVWLMSLDANDSPAALAILPFAFGTAMLALSSFGREFGLRTFALTLAQPLERVRIWRTKTTLLAGAMATVWGVWCLSCAARIHSGAGYSVWLAISGAATVVTLAGGLWTTLLLRQMAAAFWFTFLIPAAIVMVVTLIGGVEVVMFAVLGLYSVAGFVWARREFLRAQEAAWTGDVVSFPGWRSAAGDSPSSIRGSRSLAALFWKELQLHQVGLAGMACLFVLHLGVVFLRLHDFGDAIRKGMEVFGGVWLIVPLLVGGQSVAEERKLGTWVGHLSLPVSRRVQFAIKLFFVLIVGGVLSSVLMGTAEAIGSVIGEGSDIGRFKVALDWRHTLDLSFVVFCGLSLIGFYASTLARSLVQALAVAVFTLTGIGALGELFSHPPKVLGVSLWQDILIYYIAWPGLVITFLGLTYHNFKCAFESWRLWRRNAYQLVAVLAGIVVVATAGYHRVWELMTPLEPAHGPARLTAARPPKLQSYGGSALTIVLPDGTLWVNRFAYDSGKLILAFGEGSGIRLGGRWTSSKGNPIVAGSNWVDAVASFRETAGIRSDGTLWVSEKLTQDWPDGRRLPALFLEEASGLVRFGDQTNWQSLAREDYSMKSVLLLKQDGSLWRWSTNSFPGTEMRPGQVARSWPGFRAFAPSRLGTESDWAKILPAAFSDYAWKSDGSAWVLNARVKGLANETPRTIKGVQHIASLDQIKWRSLAGFWGWQFGVREDGTLWAWNSELQATSQGNDGLSTQLVQVGKDNDWSAVAGDFQTLAGIKANGTLWAWSLSEQSDWPFRKVHPLRSEAPIQWGIHDDWVAIGGALGGIVSLAADGSLWYWWGGDSEGYRNSDQPLLRASRRPSRIGNVFGE